MAYCNYKLIILSMLDNITQMISCIIFMNFSDNKSFTNKKQQL